MAAETVALRNLARRVKQKALENAEFILNNPDKVLPELYNETYLTVLKNAVPRTQEVTGEDGGAIQTAITGINYIVPNGTNTTTDTQAAPSVPSTTESLN